MFVLFAAIATVRRRRKKATQVVFKAEQNDVEQADEVGLLEDSLQ
jgi:hypothetical protein